MAHLLVVESWVGSMSRLLPRAIQEGGHTFTFLTRDLHHYLRTAPEGAAHPLLGARNVVTADTNDPASLLSYAERLHEVLGFDGVLTSCDYYLPTAALAAERLGLPAPDAEAVRNACRKDATRRVLDEAGVPGPGSPSTRSGPNWRRPRGTSATRWSSSPSTCARACWCGGSTTKLNSPPPYGRWPTSRSTHGVSGAHRQCCWRSCWTGRR